MNIVTEYLDEKGIKVITLESVRDPILPEYFISYSFWIIPAITWRS